jgi:hypothetical protein
MISSEGLDEESALAAEAAVTALLDQEFERIRERLRQHDLLPEEWRVDGGIGIKSGTRFMTVEELIEFQGELNALLERYDERSDNPELRPEGARPVRIFLSTTVSPD